MASAGDISGDGYDDAHGGGHVDASNSCMLFGWGRHSAVPSITSRISAPAEDDVLDAPIPADDIVGRGSATTCSSAMSSGDVLNAAQDNDALVHRR